MTENTEHTADNERAELALPVRLFAHALKHFSHEFPVMPLLVFDLSNSNAFVLADDGMPMTAIGIGWLINKVIHLFGG